MQQKVARLLSSASEQHRVPSVAAANVVDGKVAEVAVHGWRDQERRLPMTAATPSRWYSISKPITALALGRLVEAGKLKWDQPVSQLVPAVRFADPVATERATVGDCLLHRTGLISGDWTWYGAPSDPAELLRRLPHVSCRPGFRAGHFYQNLNFTILGEVFRSVGTDWHAAMGELLGLIGVRPITRLADFVASDRAIGYGPNGFAPPVPAPDFDFEGAAPASAVCGSITELAQLAQALATGGQPLLSPATFAEVTRPVLSLGDTEWPELRSACVALAGRTVIYRGELALQWAGGFTGYTSHLVVLPERRAAACALSARGGSPAAEALAWSMLDLAAGWEPIPWTDRFCEQKRRMRRQGAAQLAARLARPEAPWPARDIVGRYSHPAYGELSIVEGPRLRFRHIELPIAARPDGTLSADASINGGETCWDLLPHVQGDRLIAIDFGPDDPAGPSRFVRVG